MSRLDIKHVDQGIELSEMCSVSSGEIAAFIVWVKSHEYMTILMLFCIERKHFSHLLMQSFLKV